MTTLSPTTETALVPRTGESWRRGLGNLVRKELSQWWGTRLWWIQLGIWLLFLDGVSTVVMLDEGLEAAMQAFLQVGATAIGIGVVITIQGSIVSEKELGTAAWVMSKPVSRTSFILAKLVAHTVGFMVTALLVPAVVFIFLTQALLDERLPMGSFGPGVAVLGLDVLFYIVLTLALGCMFKGRGPIAGIGIGFILFGQFFKGMLPSSVVMVTPWPLGDVASSFALDQPLEFDRMIPIIVTAVLTVALIVIGIWRFNQEEF